MCVSRVVFASVFAAAWSLTSAGQFLEARQRWGSRDISADLVKDLFTSSSLDDSLLALQGELRETYHALPKNQHGLLDPATARYALHRHFVQKYGWYLRGLDPKGASWNSTTNMTIAKERLPQHIQSLFQKDAGLDLADLAKFTAVLSRLMEDEVGSGIDEIFTALRMSRNDVSDDDFNQLLQAYIARVIYGGDDEILTPYAVEVVIKEVTEIYTDWPATAMWIKDMVHTFDWLERGRRNPFVSTARTYDQATVVIRDMMHKFNQLGYPECAKVKEELAAKEVPGTGRVHLLDFYSDHDRKRESVDFLRNIGSLDESDPGRPKLIMTNFILSSANCLVDSSYYSSCCPNECEILMDSLERSLATPESTPQRIAELIGHLPSDTVDVPRNLSSSLGERLQSIADKHDGKVPLHGRLFAQWMHHVYPRECPYPQVSGQYHPMTQDEYIAANNLEDVFVYADDVKLKNQMLAWKESVGSSKDGMMPWESVEELVAVHSNREERPWKLAGLRGVMVFAAFASMTWSLVKSSSRLFHGFGYLADDKRTSHLV